MEDQENKLSGNAATVKRKRAFLKAAVLNEGNKAAATKAASISRQTFYRWHKEDEVFAVQFEEVIESLLDETEVTTFRAARGIAEVDQDGIFIGWKVRPDSQLLQFILRTRGRNRGYAEKMEHELANHIPFVYSDHAVTDIIEFAKKL